jgi:hypothetical protein
MGVVKKNSLNVLGIALSEKDKHVFSFALSCVSKEGFAITFYSGLGKVQY